MAVICHGDDLVVFKRSSITLLLCEVPMIMIGHFRLVPFLFIL